MKRDIIKGTVWWEDIKGIISTHASNNTAAKDS